MITSALLRTETERWREEVAISRPAWSYLRALGRLGVTFNNSSNLLDSPDFAPFFYQTVQGAETGAHLLKHFNFLLDVFEALPNKVMAVLNPGVLLFLKWRSVSSAPNSALRKG